MAGVVSTELLKRFKKRGAAGEASDGEDAFRSWEEKRREWRGERMPSQNLLTR